MDTDCARIDPNGWGQMMVLTMLAYRVSRVYLGKVDSSLLDVEGTSRFHIVVRMVLDVGYGLISTYIC